MNPGCAGNRYHALDSMRASMMLLGIYLHVAVVYSGAAGWPQVDAHPTRALNASIVLIHAFRMPAFFMMAGFFGALLRERRGIVGFASNRLKRILLPLVLFWPMLYVTEVAMAVAFNRGAGAVIPFFHSSELRLHPLHLWFLEYLLILYILAAAGLVFSRLLPDGLHSLTHAAFRWSITRWYAPVIFALFSWLPVASMDGALWDCERFLPSLRLLAAYSVPFGCGWLLYRNRDLLPSFGVHVWLRCAQLGALCLLYIMLPRGTHPFVRATVNVLCCWALILGTTSLFVRFYSEGSATWRYVSDASYWMYLVHTPVMLVVAMLLAHVPIPAVSKVPIVLAVVTAVLLLSYDTLVRPTGIGVLLNGRKYSRALLTPQALPFSASPQREHSRS